MPQEPTAPQSEATVQIHSTIESSPPIKVSDHIEGDFKEYLLRRTKRGNKALSLLADEELIHVTEVNRSKDGTVATQQRFMVKKEALLGISHNKFDWLDRFKLGWWSMFGGGLALSILGIPIGSTLLMAGLFFSCWQFADPEMITLETTTGRRRLMLNRMGSDRELMRCSMDHFSATIQNLLVSGELDTTDYENSIEALMLDRAAQLQAAAQQAASQVAEPLIPDSTSSAQPTAQSEDLVTPAAPIAVSPIEPASVQPTSSTSAIASPLPETEGVETESNESTQDHSQEPESSDWGAVSEWPEPAPPEALPEPAPPAELSPPPAPTPPPSLTPLPTPTPPLPMPPPGLALPPVPLLPAIDPLLMDADVAMPPPPETLVAGSPREDRMSTDEKDDLLSMLDD
ncbi:MAG: hypothetical protein NZ770_08650 [Candidatus Poseidoniaceae archaeon]|nr:hypothetical protein [Candidatus Poseidoniaceae archaeon]